MKTESTPKTAKIATVVLVVIITLIITMATVFKLPFVKSMDFFFYDLFMKISSSSHVESKSASDRITIIDIDETSLSAVGQWPWPRYRIASMIRRIARENPKAMGMDIIFPEPDRSSLISISGQFQKDFDIKIDFTNVPRALRDNDSFFSHILNQTDIVGARYFYFDHYNKGAVCKGTPFLITDPLGVLSLHKAAGVLCNTLKIETRLKSTGFINNQYDEDGLLRQTPLLIKFQDEYYPHLSLALFMKAHGITKARVNKNLFGPYIEAGQYNIPVTINGFAAMRFNNLGFSNQYIPAKNILNNDFDPSRIKDKIILIGSSAIGIHDVHHTIFNPAFPGVEVNAVIMDNIINNLFIVKPVWTDTFILLFNIVTVFAMVLLFYMSSGPVLLFSGTLVWMVSIFLLSAVSNIYLSLFISPASSILLAFMLFSLFALIRFAMEKRASFLWYQRLADAQQLTMAAMVSMVETRDPETGAHIVRTQHYARAIAEHLMDSGCFSDILTDDFIKILFLSIPLHDIGKVGIPDNILLKPDRLTHGEFIKMKMHATYGSDIIDRAAKKHQGSNYLDMGAQIANSHHERWNGQGYPKGISGDKIPLAGRIMAIADVYDALISKRCYKPPYPHEKAMAIILEEKGNIFDPIIVDAFISIEPKICEIAAQFADGE